MSDDYNKLRDVVTGLMIFLAHGGEDIEPSHDQINSGQRHDEALSPEEIATLKAAGWRNDREFCECENIDAEAEDSDDNTSGHEPTCAEWMIFT